MVVAFADWKAPITPGSAEADTDGDAISIGLETLGRWLAAVPDRIDESWPIRVKVSWLISAFDAFSERVPETVLVIWIASLDTPAAVSAVTTMSSLVPLDPATYCSWANCAAVNSVWAPVATPARVKVPPPRWATL